MENYDITQLLQLAQSPTGQQLFTLLQKNGGKQLRSAAAQASAGNVTQAGKTLAPLLEDPEVRRLLQQLGGNP